MDEQPSKRRGRPRKTVDVPDPAAQTQAANHDHDGDRQVGEAGASAQANDGRPAESWVEFVDRVKAAFAADPRLRSVWHPEPAEWLIVTDNGNLHVLQGERKGQLNTGEHIEI
jgi:hypothetical protein